MMETPAAGGQLVLTPHPVTLEGQRHIPMDLQPGERLCSFLHRHVVDIDRGDWVVSIGGHVVPRAMWAHVTPKDGQVIELRGAVGKTALYIVALVALTYFTFGAGAAAGGIFGTATGAGTFFGASGLLAAGLATATFVAGSVLINKVLGPKAAGRSSSDADSVYSIGAARNQLRQYQPLPLVFGPVKMAPDMASKPYTWYEGNDQFVGMVLTPGVNVQSIDELYNGDALLSSYDGVTVWYSGFPGMPEQTIPLYSNVDTVDGGDLPDTTAWVQRTTGADTVRVQINLEYILGGQGTSGKNYQVSETVQVQYSPAGLNQWATLISRTFSSSKLDTTQRATLAADVARGQYDVRVRILGQGNYTGKNTQRNDFQWSTLSSVQADDATYAGIPRIGIRIKATGQLNGAPDEIRGVVHSLPCQVWDGDAWVAEESSNPGANILQYARGYRDQNGRLIGGMGLPDSWIDIEALMGFTLHCAASSYSYKFCIKEARSHEEMLDALALAGMGQVSWAGGRLSVVWAADQQPMSGVVNMATIKKGSFQVDYTLANAADGIEYSYYDEETWETKTLRVVSPAAGYDTALNPAQVTGEGITSEAHAAIMARWHLAQSLYQYKDIRYSTDLEHLSYRRMSVLALQHDLTQWGYGGCVVGAGTAGGVTTLQLDEPVPPPASGNAYIGVRIPGEAVYRVLRVQSFSGDPTDTITLADEWPNDAALPGAGAGNPAHDTIWVYDFKQTPGYRVRVVNVEPESDTKGASIAVVPEGPEFWQYVLYGVYTPPANQSLLQTRPIASNLVISEEQTVQGDTVFTELVATFDITGPASRTVVLSDLDRNGELEQVAETTTRTARWRIPGAGTYPITVRPYSPDGFAGVSASTLYTTQGAEAPPVLVDTFTIEELSGGVRRYSWGYSDDTIQSADFAGVEIRYTAGSVTAPAWETMTPLGDTGYHAAAFEAVLPASGTWTFACRSRNTSGTLSPDARIVTQTLGANLGEQLGDLGDADAAAQAAITQEIIDRFNADAAAIAQAAQDATDKANAARDAAIAHADVIGAQVADIIGADEWVTGKDYPKGDLVKHNGTLYRALRANNSVEPGAGGSGNDWQSVGNYDSLGEAVAASISMGTANASAIASEAQQLDAVQARMPSGAGQLATQASVATEQQARVDGDNALSGRTSTIEGRMPTGTDKLANEARVVTAENASVTRDNALGARVDSVQAKLPADGGRSASEANVTSFAQASVDRDNVLGQRVDTAQAAANGAQSTATNALTASNNNASAITLVQKKQSQRTNLLPGGGFERGRWTNGEYQQFATADGSWGRQMYHTNPGSINGGGHAVVSDAFDVTENEPYTVSFDSLLIANAGGVRVDIQFFNSSGGNTGSGSSNSRAPSFNFDDGDARRQSNTFSAVAPAGSTQARVRYIWEGVTGCVALAVRQVKVEHGDGPSTAYTSEAMLALTATAQAASFTLALQVNNYVSGITSVNNGTTSTIDFLTDAARFLSPNGGARTEFSNGNWRVYDQNGVLVSANGINI
ncbi:host specificity factor TipJ family phage tail protein [Pseudoxanthomonas winnipegensis]|nr:host specificity factor TipJ family phage tail protein [Pseudoxanthomonas winnipegensis]